MPTQEPTPMDDAFEPENDPTPSPADVEFMAAALEARHGLHAASVAEFFSSMHDLKGDAGRSWAWAGVAARVRQREKCRVRG